MYLLPLKVPHREIEFELYLCFFIYSSFIHLFIFFLLLFICFTLFNYINQVWHFCFESFNNSPACIYFPLKVPSPQRWVLNCIYVYYLFIHSLIRIFFLLYLFVSLNLIYINQVWHFCFEIVQKYTPIYFHSKCVTAT